MVKHLLVLLVCGCFVHATSGQEKKNTQPQNNTHFTWKRATPESVGVSSIKLDLLGNRLKEKNTNKLVIIKNDRIIFEYYAPGHEAQGMFFTDMQGKILKHHLSIISNPTNMAA